MESRIEIAIDNIDIELKSIQRRLNAIPIGYPCDTTFITMLNNQIYESINLRAIGLQKIDSNHLCTSNGNVDLNLTEQFWRGGSKNGNSLAIYHTYKHVKDRSLMVMIQKNNYYIVGAVNPLIVERLWVDDRFNAASSALYVDRVAEPLYELREESSKGKTWFTNDIFNMQVPSTQFPYSIKTTLSPTFLIHHLSDRIITILLLCICLSGFLKYFSNLLFTKVEQEDDYMDKEIR